MGLWDWLFRKRQKDGDWGSALDRTDDRDTARDTAAADNSDTADASDAGDSSDGGADFDFD